MARRWRSLLIVGFCALAAAACERAPKSTTLRFNVPTQTLKSKGIGSFEVMPTNRVACYGVNIKGLGTSVSASPCSPPAGLQAGFVAAGKQLEATVPRGSTISVELFLYLQPEGQNLICPAFVPLITNERLANLYLVGKSETVTVAADDNVIDIVATFPGLNNNVAQQMNMPAVCRAVAGVSGATPFSISSGVQTLTGTGMTVRAKASDVGPRTVLTGTDMQVIVR